MRAARLATIVFAAIFSIIVNVSDGARAVPREYIEVARSFRAKRFRSLFEIVLPSATPYFLAGVRLAAGRAVIGAVVAEFFTAIPGVGHYILFMSRTFRHDVSTSTPYYYRVRATNCAGGQTSFSGTTSLEPVSTARTMSMPRLAAATGRLSITPPSTQWRRSMTPGGKNPGNAHDA